MSNRKKPPFAERMKDLERRYRKVSGLKDRSSYAIFYCPVRPAPVLVLGINPGGHPENVYPDGVRLRSGPGRGAASTGYYENNEHCMLDCDWPENRIVPLLASLLGDRESIRDKVVKTNLAFRRAPNVREFERVHPGMTILDAYEEAQPFIREIIGIVQPRLVILESGKKEFLPTFKRCAGTTRSTPLGDSKAAPKIGNITVFRAERAMIPNVSWQVSVVQIPHPSRFHWTYERVDVVGRIRRLLPSKALR